MFQLLDGALKSVKTQQCPSGKNHTIVERVVKNVVGKKYCCHPDCTRANMEEVLKFRNASFD